MTLSAFITVLTAFFKFPEALTALVKVLEKTTEERRSEIVKKIQVEAEKTKSAGRPEW